VFQASEGGPVSVGRRKFQANSGATPTPAPQNKFDLSGGNPAHRISSVSRMGGVTPLASPLAGASASREIVLSRSSLAGICLITFACGIVTTVMVDRARTRGSDRDVVLAREPEPTPARTAPEAAPAVAAPVAPMPVAPMPAPPSAPSAAAAAEPVVVQMANLDETSKSHSTALARSAAVAAVHARPIATPVAAGKAKPVGSTGLAPVTAKAKSPAPLGLSQAPAKAKSPAPLGLSQAPAKAKSPAPLGLSQAPAKAKSPAPLGLSQAPAKARPPVTTAAKVKPAAAAAPTAANAKKSKSSDPNGPPTEWVDPFTQ